MCAMPALLSTAAAPGPQAPRPRLAATSARCCGPQTADEMVIGVALTARWMIATGRRLHEPPLLHSLPADQLLDFWADDHASQHRPRASPTRCGQDRRQVSVPGAPFRPRGGTRPAASRPGASGWVSRLNPDS
jgi:hypothetical protein